LFLDNLNMAKKMAVPIVVAAIFLGLVGGAGYYYLTNTNHAIEKMYQEKLFSVKYSMDSSNQSRAEEIGCQYLGGLLDE
jgi:hypothetical protein